jgi:hypothetical protein
MITLFGIMLFLNFQLYVLRSVVSGRHAMRLINEAVPSTQMVYK